MRNIFAIAAVFLLLGFLGATTASAGDTASSHDEFVKAQGTQGAATPAEQVNVRERSVEKRIRDFEAAQGMFGRPTGMEPPCPQKKSAGA